MKMGDAMILAGVVGAIVLLSSKTARGYVVNISQRGLDFLKRIEGFAPTPYADAGGKSVGYGHFIQPGEKITALTTAQGEQLLSADVQKVEAAIARYVTVPLTQGQHDALVSFIYNVGEGAFSTSTLLKKLNAGDYAGAAQQFAVWNKTHTPSGQFVVSPTLVARRASEMQIFLS